MLGRAVALVASEAVAGKGAVQPLHQPIPCHLGADRSRGHRQAARVRLDEGSVDRPVGAIVWKRQSVHDDVIRPYREPVKGPEHGEPRGAHDAVPVNGPWTREGDTHRDRQVPDADLPATSFAGREPLGVRNAPQQAAVAVRDRRQDDGGGGDRSRPGPTSRLVHTRDAAQPTGEELPLEPRICQAGGLVADGGPLSR